jgi:hypothetical protein
VRITCISARGGRTTLESTALLGPALREAARREANAWIKRLRLVRYGRATMRERFIYRGDSLWWFTEVYLHKMRRLDAAVQTLLALAAARDAGAARLAVRTPDPAERSAALAFGRAHGIAVELEGAGEREQSHRGPGLRVGLSARLSRWRPRPRWRPERRPRVAAFVHTAFWRSADPQQETYIGPVLDALVAEASRDEVSFVGVGPRRNFRARRWWDPVTPSTESRPPVTPVERLAPMRALRESMALWAQRRRLADEIVRGEDIRSAGVVLGCDLWPVLRHGLQGAAIVQWPWSARSMDEAAAALEALQPGAVVTYAEAGAWGRALVLEARRRAIPSFGIQHGFIYRHWLNYQHEPDEMTAVGADRGFPRPDHTLVYDRYASEHLITAGHFPAASVEVTGSARLEALAARLASLRPQREQIRQRHRLKPGQPLAVLAAKFSEIREDLPALMDAVSRLPDVHLVIKPHPAETPDLYAAAGARRANVAIASRSADLAELLAAADILVTMNSTVAIDGLVLGVPSIVIGLPNNLSPFVDAGVMLGADGPEAIERALKSVLYDRQVRQDLATRAGAFAADHQLAPPPGAAARAARAILADHV